MKHPNGLQVTVDGDLPAAVLERIAESVRKTVLREVASLDLEVNLEEAPPPEQFAVDRPAKADGLGFPVPFPLGIWLRPDDQLFP